MSPILAVVLITPSLITIPLPAVNLSYLVSYKFLIFIELVPTTPVKLYKTRSSVVIFKELNPGRLLVLTTTASAKEIGTNSLPC
nr:MAG TPA: hypothetical protein [Caudoviricetes sp.]